MAAIDIAGMKTAFGYKPDDEEAEQPAAPETGVIDITGMKSYFADTPKAGKPTVAAPVFGVQLAPEKVAKVGESAKRFLAEQPSIGQVAAETGAGLASMADVVAGVVPMVAGTGAYALGRALQQTPEEATKLQQKVEAPLMQPVGRMFGVTEQPGYQQSAANRLMQFVGENLEKGAAYIAGQTGLPQTDVQNMINSLTLVAPQAVKGAGKAVKTGAERVAATAPEITPEAQAAFTATPEIASLRRGEMTPEQIAAAPVSVQQAAGLLRNAGAAQTTTPNMVQAALQAASPELQQVVSNIPVNKVNLPVLERHIEADTLPVPMRLTEGMATQDPIIISNEQNMRARSPEMAQRFNELNADLVENVGAIRDIAAPDVFVNTKKENAAAIMDSYRSMDQARREQITEAYKALEDANGGQFPIDIQAAIQNADAALGTKLKTEFLPSAIQSQLEKFRQGAPMTFEQFEALRTNLAAEIRKAERAKDGNAAMASSIVREALEDMPLAGQAKGLKALADNARKLAKERFDTINKDPAYKAVIDEKVSDRDFFDKYVINGVDKNIQTMLTNLSGDPLIQQHLMRGTMQHLSDKAGLTEQGGTFSSANYNKAVKHLADTNNLDTIFTPEIGTHLRTLGNVAHYTTYQPKGSFVNNSGTLVAALSRKVGGAIVGGMDIASVKAGLPPLGTALTTVGEGVKARKAAQQSLAPAAGVTYKTPIRNMVPPRAP